MAKPTTTTIPSTSVSSLSTKQQQRRRYLSTLVWKAWDVVRTGSLRPPNPLLVTVDEERERRQQRSQTEPKQDHDENDENVDYDNSAAIRTTTNSSSSTIDIDFTIVRPHHLVDAAQQVQKEYMANWQTLQETLLRQQQGRLETTTTTGGSSSNDDDDSSITTTTTLQSSTNNGVSTEWLLDQLVRLEGPTEFVLNVAALYSNLIQIPHWDIATRQVSSILDDNNKNKRPHEHSQLVLKALQSALLQEEEEEQAINGSSSNNVLAIRHYLNRYMRRGVDQRRDEHDTTIQSLQESLEEIEGRFLLQQSAGSSGRHGENSMSSSMVSLGGVKQKLQDMYAMIGIKNQQATLLGYDNYVDQVLATENRMATSVDDITSLHEAVKERFAHVDAMPLATYPDTQQYLSLDGVLLAMFALARAMFGIVFRESDSPRGWDPDVRLFGAYDEATNTELGKLYLDAFFRGPKARFFFVSPLDRRSVFLGANIPPPAWNDMSTPLKFRDALSLVHEFGHVLQFMLAQDHLVATQYMPQDVSEVMPQLMEHFLFEEPILQSIAHVSGAAGPFPSDLVEQLRKQRVAEKVHIMNERAFLGQLELELFSGSDESLVSLQRRLAQEYVPQQLPEKNDLTPLFTIMNDSANDKNVCRYRYLFGEVMSSDIYRLFQEVGVEDEEKMRELGMRLRATMLEPGGLLEGRTAFKTFSGHDMSPDALFALYGGDQNKV